MPVPADESTTRKPLIELKGSSVTLPILKLLDVDAEAAAKQLARRIEQSPDFFRNAPLIIDLQAVKGGAVNFAALLKRLGELDLRPIGVRNGDEAQHKAAQAAGLAAFGDSLKEQPLQERSAAAPPRQARASARSAPPVESRAKLITQPVRSGQKVYAQGADLIVLAPVSPGAEIMADGNIHVYSALRGRALAGVKGDMESRIFCRDLHAELISIAGHYRVSENLEEDKQGKSVQIYLRGEALVIEAL
jgi:septum site-determining protein MinC